MSVGQLIFEDINFVDCQKSKLFVDKFLWIQVVSIIANSWSKLFENRYFQGSVNFHKFLENFYP